MTLEERFVAALLPKLPPHVVEAMRADAAAGVMTFDGGAINWGPPGQTRRLEPLACALRAEGHAIELSPDNKPCPDVRDCSWDETNVAQAFDAAAIEVIDEEADYVSALGNDLDPDRLLAAFRAALVPA